MSLIIIDDVVFSEECFNWFNEREHLAPMVLDEDLSIDVFRFLLPNNYIQGVEKKENYQDITAGEFWILLNEILLLMTDIHKTKTLPINFSTNAIRDELLKIEKMVVYWSLTLSHDPKTLGNLPEVYITTDNHLNNSFCLDSFLLVSACKWGLEKLETVLMSVVGCRQVNEMQQYEKNALGMREFNVFSINEFFGNDVAMSKFVKDLVRMGYGGDFDEFIINVKNKIASTKLGPYHYKMALARGYDLLGITDFSDIEASEAWRRLFTTYFDGDEDNYDTFYNTYMYDCLNFLLLDYLSIDKCSGIDYIPIYKIYSRNFLKSYSFEAQSLVDTKFIRTKLLKLYNKTL